MIEQYLSSIGLICCFAVLLISFLLSVALAILTIFFRFKYGAKYGFLGAYSDSEIQKLSKSEASIFNALYKFWLNSLFWGGGAFIALMFFAVLRL